MKHEIDAPTPVLAVTTRAGASPEAAVIEASLAALRETARRLEITPIGPPLRVDHDDPAIVEVCLVLAAMPDAAPPPPIAAEMLTPGTSVESLG